MHVSNLGIILALKSSNSNVCVDSSSPSLPSRSDSSALCTALQCLLPYESHWTPLRFPHPPSRCYGTSSAISAYHLLQVQTAALPGSAWIDLELCLGAHIHVASPQLLHAVSFTDVKNRFSPFACNGRPQPPTPLLVPQRPSLQTHVDPNTSVCDSQCEQLLAIFSVMPAPLYDSLIYAVPRILGTLGLLRGKEHLLTEFLLHPPIQLPLLAEPKDAEDGSSA